MEGTTVFANIVTYVVNVTQVKIEAYTDSTSTVGLARMVGVVNSSQIIAPSMPTKFNLLANKNLLLDEILFNNDGFDSDDRSSLSQPNAVFKPFHAGFVIKNFRFLGVYIDGKETTQNIFEIHRVDTRMFSLIN